LNLYDGLARKSPGQITDSRLFKNAAHSHPHPG